MLGLSILGSSASMGGLAPAGDGSQGAAGCLACGGFLIVLVSAIAVANIAMLVWVARDAKNRGMDGAVLWMLLVFFTGPLGLVIYLFSRPNGAVVPCSRCRNSKLAASVKCPHCGNA
ncbi:MAG: hypothetical protein RL685_2331 [Pseudomonadota bacterium]